MYVGTLALSEGVRWYFAAGEDMAQASTDTSTLALAKQVAGTLVLGTAGARGVARWCLVAGERLALVLWRWLGDALVRWRWRQMAFARCSVGTLPLAKECAGILALVGAGAGTLTLANKRRCRIRALVHWPWWRGGMRSRGIALVLGAGKGLGLVLWRWRRIALARCGAGTLPLANGCVGIVVWPWRRMALAGYSAGTLAYAKGCVGTLGRAS